MCHHKHLSILERESIFKFTILGLSLRKIAKKLNRSPSTISRELKRNTKRKDYSPAKATKRYEKKRKFCRPKFKLADPTLKQKVLNLLNLQWSPEQIANRMKMEGTAKLSFQTIYRAINRQMFEEKRLSGKMIGIRRQLRHHGRHKKSNISETRGKIPISNDITSRPQAANERSECGHLEADTVAGYMWSGALLTMVDRKSRYTYAEMLSDKKPKTLNEGMLKILRRAKGIKSITPDRGHEFSYHKEITEETGIEFYFPPPRQPWRRGTNENTNKLLRQYFPRRKLFTIYSEETVTEYIERLNQRPRKILNWLSPAEVAFNKVLHLT